MPPWCLLIARKYAKEFSESSQYSNLVLLLPSWCVEPKLFLRNLVLLCPRTPSAISALSCPNELLLQIVILLDDHDAAIVEPF